MMTLFEATRRGLIERKQIPGRRARLRKEAVYWIVIRSDAPEEAIQKAGLPFDDAARSWIGAPERHPTFRVKGKWAYADFAVYSSDDDDEPDYVRVAIGQNVLLTIGSERTGILGEIYDEIRSVISDKPPGLLHLLFNVTNALISAHAEWAAGIRKQVDRLAKRVDTDTRSVEVDEILKAKNLVAQLSHVLEEQSITLGFVPKVNWRRDTHEIRGEFSQLRTSLASLENSLDNMWDRLESIHNQYMLVLQESSNKKLNVLAIVQSIFVPLTFIGGIYGMNFVNMPELEWHYGYVATLGLMGLITLYSLQYFIRHGWFK